MVQLVVLFFFVFVCLQGVFHSNIFRFVKFKTKDVLDSERDLFARLVYQHRVSSLKKDESLLELCLSLAATCDFRCLRFRIQMCANTFEGNPRRSHKRTCVRRVVSQWFSLMSWSEKSVLGSDIPKMYVYFRLICASGLTVADQSESSFFDVRSFSLDCKSLFKECNLESAHALRNLIRACIVPLLKDICN